MTTFAEMETLVTSQTRRPEVPDITKAAIKSATLRAHHTDFFPRDLQVTALPYTISSTAVYYDFPNINTSLLRTLVMFSSTVQRLRLRSLKFLQSIDAATFAPTESLEYRDADDLFDRDGVRRASMYTVIGATVRAYPQSVTGLLNFYYFQNPDVAELTYSSWIADTYAEELAMWAAGIVFARTGYVEMAQKFKEDHVDPFKGMLVASHLLGNVA